MMIKANPNATQSEFDGKVIVPWVNINLSKNEAEALLTALQHFPLELQRPSENIHGVKYSDIYNTIRQEVDDATIEEIGESKTN
jgi:hypothetical protein|tara:strand:- start:2362 stop:2613 length:252 start_codon:yes stop_codon:yes gene_type:complete